MKASSKEAPIPWRPQLTAPRYSLHGLQAAYQVQQLPVCTIFYSMEQQMLPVQLDTTALLTCLANPPISNRSVSCQSIQAVISPVLCGCVLQVCCKLVS